MSEVLPWRRPTPLSCAVSDFRSRYLIPPSVPKRNMSESTLHARSPPRQYSDSWFEPFREGESAASTSALLDLGSDSSTSLLRGHGPGSTRAWPSLGPSNSTWGSASHTQKNESDVIQTRQDIDQDNLDQESRLRRRRDWPVFITKPQTLRALCFNLHFGLVLLHCVLLGISLSHLENRKVIPLGHQSTAWSIGIPALSQVFITVYSAGILVLTQQLSLRRNLLVRQTLTATHDKTTAWNGLGSSLLSLWRQMSVAASIWGVAFIMIYLAGISVLHISTPTLLTLESFNNTIQTNLSTTRALPNPDVHTIDNTAPIDFVYFAQAAPILPLMGQYSQLSTIGVHGNTVYDMLPDNQGRGNVSVNSTTFDVHCDVLQNPRATPSTSGKWNITADFLPVEGGQWEEDENFQVPLISPNVVRMPPLEPLYEDLINFYSSVNFTDSQGGNGSRLILNPPMIANEGDSVVYSLQVMGCRFFSSNNTIYVDAQTKVPVDPPQQKTSSTWGKAQPSPRFKNSTELATIHSWKVALHYVSTLRGTLTATRCAVLSQCDYFTVIDQFLVQQLGLKPDIDPRNNPQPHPELQLYQLENALANLTAALHWSTTQLKPENSGGSSLFNMAFSGQATVSQPQLASRLKLNVIPISFGLGASVILLIISVLLVGKPEGKADAVDSTGILHLIWLLRDRPDLQNQLGRVESPSTEYLRTAGMFEVRLAGEYGSVNHEMTPVIGH